MNHSACGESALIVSTPIINPRKINNKFCGLRYCVDDNYYEGGFMSIAVCPLPVVPSNTNRLDIGISRALSAFRMSCARTPPTTAQTGENSCAAVVESDLEEVVESGGSSQFLHDQVKS